MPIYSIRGYDVDFPHEAYPCQITYMEQVLGALEQSENALLESPTGTGKTLCLLCATLAWREALIKRGKAAAPGSADSSALSLHEYKQQQAGIGAPADAAAAQHRGPAVIYSSRTHSQLAQVIKELRNTSYRVRTTVLGSRQQLCLNDKVSRLPGQAANFTCRALVQHKQCRWHSKHRHDKVLQELNGAPAPAPVDIEELGRVGRHAEVCPYFLSRDMANTADVIFMPYNYLVDSNARGQLSGINWNNAVVIIDEAHNIQDACNSNASFDLSGEQLLNAIAELEKAAEITQESISSGRASEGLLLYQDEGKLHHDVAAAAGGGVGSSAELLERLQCGTKIISALYQKVCELDPANPGPAAAAAAALSAGGSSRGTAGGSGGGSSGGGSDGGVAYKGEFLLQLLAGLDINADSYGSHLQQLLVDAAGVLSDHELASGRAMAAKSGVAAAGLSALMSALDIAFASVRPLWVDPVRRTSGPPAHRGYRLFVHRPELRGGGGQGTKKRGGLLPGSTAPTLSYWCFIPGVSMAALRQLPLRSVLLTSGTLAPLESFAHELQLGFKFSLENPHVIAPNQVWVGVVPGGPTGVALNSSYANRGSSSYKDDLGFAIVNFARVVPDGLLVFFPAYSLLTAAIDHWKASSGTAGGPTIWERILRHKAPVIEPRESSAFAAAIADYQAKLDDPAGGGAVLFAVCRGKVSEGLDFSDRAGRGVVITGLPFPAAFDPHVRLQRQLLDEESRAGAGGISGGRGLTGEQWYVQQGLRAVNQAMGRVIRHRWDYGAVLLADERFGSAQNQRQLSKWLREHVEHHPSFGAAIGSLTKFFKDKGDVVASARAAAGLPPPSTGSKAAAPSAFQLLAGLEGGGRGPGAAAAAAAARLTAEQQRRLQLAMAPRAIDVAGIVGAGGGGDGEAQPADALPGGSQLDSLALNILPAAAAARSALLAAGAAARSRPPAAGLQQPGGPGRLQRGSVLTLAYESSDGPAAAARAGRQPRGPTGGLLGLSGAAAAAGAGACAAAASDASVVGPAHLVQQHKFRQQQQQQQQPPGPAQGAAALSEAAGQQQQQQAKEPGKKGREPLRMGQFLKVWNSTQLEQQAQQQQQQQEQQQQQQRQEQPAGVVQQQQQQQQQQQTKSSSQGAAVGAVPQPPPADPKSFLKQLQEQLPPAEMATVKALLTAYRSTRNLTAFVDGLVAALGTSGSSSSSSSSGQRKRLLAGFAAFLPAKDQDWFLRLVAAHGNAKGGAPAVAPAASAGTSAVAAGDKNRQPQQQQQQQLGSSLQRQQLEKQRAAQTALGSSRGVKRDCSQAGLASSAAGAAGAAAAGGLAPASKKQMMGHNSSSSLGRLQPGSSSSQQKPPPIAAASKPAKQQPAKAAAAAAAVAASGSGSSKLLQRRPGIPAAAPAAPAAAKAGPGSSAAVSRAGSTAAAAAAGGAGAAAAAAAAAGKPQRACCMCGARPMAAPYRSACSHFGCYSCWLELLSANLRGMACPSCGKLVRRQQLSQVPFA